MGKKLCFVMAVIVFCLAIVLTVSTLVDDAKNGRGVFMSTATYREIVRSGK